MRFKGLVTRPASNRRGAALALVALGMPVLLGMVALGVDLGMMFSARSEAQRAADSGALAGAAHFQFAPDANAVVAAAEAEAMEFATKNFIRDGGIAGAEVTVEANPAVEMVRVTVTREIPTWFAQIFGLQSVTVAAQAVAEAATADTPQDDCVLPFAVPDLWMPDGNDDTGLSDGSGSGNNVWDFTPNTSGSNNAQHDPGEIWGFDGGANGEIYGDAEGKLGDTPTGWGTNARNPYADAQGRKFVDDYARPIPISLQLPANSDTPSFWYTWVIPGAANKGMDGIRQAIENCGTPVDVGAIGDSVEFDVETKNGLMSNPVWRAMKEHIEGDDPGAYWDEKCTDGVCTGEIKGSKYGDHLAALDHSKRVFTIALFHPADQASGKQYMRFADFARVFLEPMGTSFHNDITARFIGALPGSNAGGAVVGSNIKVLRLIDEDLWVPPAS